MHRLLLGNPASGRFGSYRELEVTALAAHDPRGQFIAATLGPLAEDSPAAARLRETLRVYLEEADNAPRTAARLYTHRNTILKRIARATELLGYLPGERRLAIGLALDYGATYRLRLPERAEPVSLVTTADVARASDVDDFLPRILLPPREIAS